MKKKKQDGSRYFRQKDIARPIAGALLIASVLAIWLRLSWIAFLVAGIVAPVALVVFFVGGSRLISDKEIDEQIENGMRDYDRPILEMPNYEQVVLRLPAPVEAIAYSFGEDAKYFRCTKSGQFRSDRYNQTHYFLTSEILMVIGRTLTLSDIGDTGFACEEYRENFLLSEIHAALEEHATPVTMSTGGKAITVKWCELVLTAKDGEELLRRACSNDLAMAGLCEEINRR